MKDLTLRQAAELWVSSSVDGIKTCVIEALMDFDLENWREITVPVIGSTVYVNSKGEDGEIVGYVERVKKFRIRLRSERICYAKADDLEVSFFEPLPMWGTMWSFSDNLDRYWLEERGGLEKMSKCGFRIFEHDTYGCYFGIDGAGYDFYKEQELERIREFERNYNALVYTVVRGRYQDFGTLDAYLYVSDERSEWEYDAENFKHNEAFAYVYCHDCPWQSEFGYIGIKLAPAAGLVRTW